jgi:hypothetical protein
MCVIGCQQILLVFRVITKYNPINSLNRSNFRAEYVFRKVETEC